jgi:predicted nucleotidyltransferase
MKIAAIIAEYNPFHNGHAYHIAETRSRADHIICVLSGNFMQRGEPAIADKWIRTRLALAGGADIVIELPFLYATQSAEGFAAGGIRLLEALRCVDFLSFGAEINDTELFTRIARVLVIEPSLFKQDLKARMDQGLPFAHARERALSSFLNIDLSGILNGANNILAIEYIKALIQQKSHILPHCIKRDSGTKHTDQKLRTGVSSALSIRLALEKYGFSREVSAQVPEPCLPFYNFTPLTSTERYFTLLMFRLRSMRPEDIARIWDVGEGLEYRIKRASKIAQNLEELIALIKTKRYTRTRICRILLYCLFQIEKSTVLQVNSGAFPMYARILGYRKIKSALLSRLCAQASIPVLRQCADFIYSPLLHFDHRASDIYALLHQKITPAGRDFTEKLIVL